MICRMLSEQMFLLCFRVQVTCVWLRVSRTAAGQWGRRGALGDGWTCDGGSERTDHLCSGQTAGRHAERVGEAAHARSSDSRAGHKPSPLSHQDNSRLNLKYNIFDLSCSSSQARSLALPSDYLSPPVHKTKKVESL